MVPAGVRRYPARLWQHIAIKEQQNVVDGHPSTGIPSPGDPESASLLTFNSDVQRRPGSDKRRLRPVIDDHYLKEVTGVSLAFECRQGLDRRLIVKV